MSETTGSESNELTITQLRNILHQDHIRKHLVQTGYIDKQGNVVRKKNNNNSQLKTSQTSQSRQSCPFMNQSRTSTDNRLKSASSSQTRRKKRTPTLSSRVNQSTAIHNVLLRRAVSPKLLYPDERCLITVKYIGLDLNIEYDRDYFEPDGDEIVLLQQHCGGENLLVVKEFFRRNDTITFASRRHTDYPFALAFYLNGVIKDRLSLCCESRCQSYTPIGGKKALIAIVAVENARPCRRCRYEERIKKLIENERISPQRDFIKINIERVSSEQRSNKQKLKPKTNEKHSPVNQDNRASTNNEHRSPRISSASSSPSPPPIPKRSPTNTKSNVSHQRTQKPTSPQQVSSRDSTPELTTNNKTNVSHKRNDKTASPRQVSSRDSTPDLTTNNKSNVSRKRNDGRTSPKQVSSRDSTPDLTTNNKSNVSRKRNDGRTSPQQVSSRSSTPEPSAVVKQSLIFNNLSPQPVSSGTSTPERTISNKFSDPPLNVIHDKSPSLLINHARTSNQNMSSDDERISTSKQTNRFSIPTHQSQVNNGSTSPQLNINNDRKPINSLVSSLPLSKPKKRNRHSSNPPHISTEDESESNVANVSDESSSDTNRYSHSNNVYN